MNKPTSLLLPENYITDYNGQKVKWFIGDYDSEYELWQAWGSCNGRAYQMGARFNRKTRMLTNIKVFKQTGRSDNDVYFHQETYDLLTR